MDQFNSALWGASSSHTMAWLQHPLCCNAIFFIFLLYYSCFPSIMRVDKTHTASVEFKKTVTWDCKRDKY